MQLAKQFKRIGKLTCRLYFPALAVLLITLSANVSTAHNLWIVGDVENKNAGGVHLYFEHHVGPGDGSYTGPIAERGKTWVRTPQGESTPITMKVVQEKNTKYLVGDAGISSGPYGVDHTSLYGVYHGRLDFFHGRYIKVTDRKSLADLAESPHLPFQLVPVWTPKGLLVRVVYFSQPYPRAKVMLVSADGTEKELKANNKGELLVPINKSGKYHLSSLAFETEAAGAFEYKAYKGIMHGTTLTIQLPSNLGN